MSAKITTKFGHAVPPAPRHSVTVHMPGWENIEKYAADSRAVIATFDNVYPRMRPHKDIAASASECVEYAISPRRDDGTGRKPVEAEKINIRALVAKDPFFAVVFPREQFLLVAGFWSTPGVGVSSRFAEDNLKHVDKLTKVDVNAVDASRPSFETPEHEFLRGRIIHYLDRSPLTNLQPRPLTKDVYLFPTGMGGIYKTHSYLTNFYHGTTILFGMAFMNTITAFQEFGQGFKFFGLGTDYDLRDLEFFLEDERKNGRKVQAIWAEFPANPLLVTPDIAKLRSLATEYDTVFIIDDTIASFASVDIANICDILVTSLTKSFNGYADAIAGSVILNPDSPKYDQLKELFHQNYIPELYGEDAKVIEANSHDYLVRTTKLNQNAEDLVRYLHSCAQDPRGAIRKVYYTSHSVSTEHYQQFMRPATPDFKPGYGCLFSVEFEDIPTTIAFYDTLNVHKGPHLGAPFTLAFAYTMCLYGTRLDFAAQYGLKPTQIRISAGLEDIDTLIEEFRIAVEAANKTKVQALVE
ncbi:pyridoxal phosphate-dependent transferase [Xylogone sp. PMI_703]|nr:pyridoxal phosphate-dependent transferase [Xylogone sp. PMI_703]